MIRRCGQLVKAAWVGGIAAGCGARGIDIAESLTAPAVAVAGGSSLAVLLLLPFIGLLWIPFFNQTDPTLFGFPFFYWYQLAWVPITSLLIFIVWRGRKHGDGA
jgi:hypothetical protein